MVGAEKKRIISFLQENFDSTIVEERHSLDFAFDRGEILYIIGFDGKGEIHHIIAAIMYVSCAEGSYINWFAVSDKTYDSTKFGKFSINQPFCNMGLGSFLLQMVQLQAVAQGYSSNLYLQANMATTAAVYYQHWGFVKTDTNEPKHLPNHLLRLCEQAKNEKATSPFVFFVTDADQRQDAIQNKTDPNSPEVQARFMHLLKLEGLLKLTGNAKDAKEACLI